jgi:serine/threonine-protein kinase
VFEARDRELGRTVALKVYHQPERDRAQLLSEARVAAALAGPGVVRVFDVDPADGWLAIEWASLGALRDLLRPLPEPGARVSLEALATWVPKLAAALARVHEQGWVHHDVKPANILMSTDDDGRPTPWLADFGSARRMGEPSPPGSLGYVSPERIAGRASDPRDDVYGFGRVLEDVLGRVGPHDEAWRRLAVACVGPDDQRPRDGETVRRLLPQGLRAGT